jgi:hypothetical protein
MELYNQIIKFVDINLIYCLFPMILTLILIELFFKFRYKTKKALNIIRYLIISYTIITIIHFLIELTIKPDEFELISRVTGSWKLAYLLIFICATILPLTLFNKKLASKSLYLLLIGSLMKIGAFFERIVIVVTSFHRDYLTNGNIEPFLPKEVILIIVLQGSILGILTLLIVEIIERNIKVHNKL